MQPTPLRGPKIGGILKVIFGPIAFAIEQCGAADGQAVMRPNQRSMENRNAELWQSHIKTSGASGYCIADSAVIFSKSRLRKSQKRSIQQF